jgi:hypothetical protein
MLRPTLLRTEPSLGSRSSVLLTCQGHDLGLVFVINLCPWGNFRGAEYAFISCKFSDRDLLVAEVDFSNLNTQFPEQM